MPRRGPGEGTGYSEILWSPLAKPSFGGPFLQWASRAGAEGTAGAGALTPALPPASACLPRDQGPPDGRPTPTKKTQRGKRPGPQQVLGGVRLWGDTCLPGCCCLGFGIRGSPLHPQTRAGGLGWREPVGAGAQSPRGGERPGTGSPRATLHCGPAQENPQSQAQKKARPSAEASILADARGSVSASDHGTLNPMAPGSCQLSAPGISLKEAANVVVKCLTPFYKEGKFASKVG